MTEQTLSAGSFFKTLIDLSLDFFSKIMHYVFIWVFPDFLAILYSQHKKCLKQNVEFFPLLFIPRGFANSKKKLFFQIQFLCISEIFFEMT
jgi:hypothetical protein